MKQDVRQATLTLPFFNEDVPVLYIEDESYVPVISLCQMLGIRADTRIPRWRKLLIWEEAQKLPLHRQQRTHWTWCIPVAAIPFLLSYFDWSSVSSDRRAQLRQMTETSKNLLEQARQERTHEYQQLRPLLFLFLTKMDGAEDLLQETTQQLFLLLDDASSKQLEVLTKLGKSLLQKVTNEARSMLHELSKSLIVDAVRVDTEGIASDTFSLPLFPVLPREQNVEQFLLKGHQLLSWHNNFLAFLEEHGLPRTSLLKP